MDTTYGYGYWEFWAPYDPISGSYDNQKVVFDGINKLIIINPEVTSLRVKEDIYSNWKEWAQVRDNSKFLPAIRTTGGDPVGGGQFAGDIYFTINGWKIVVNEQVTVDGIIYDDVAGVNPFIIGPGAGVRNTVSNLAIAYSTEGVDAESIRIEIDTNSTKLADIDSRVNSLPTAAEIWSYSVRDLTTSMTPLQFWNFLLSTPMTAGSAGEKLKQVLTTSNFLALK